MLNIGEKIKTLRKAQDVTQEKLADYLNISSQAVSKWGNGTCTARYNIVAAIGKLFRCDGR